MSTLGLCMIVKDEEKNLRRLLASVAGIFDSIYIVDTGSTDGTKMVAREFGCDVYDFTRQTNPESFDEIGLSDFAAARNFSFSQCKCEYTSWLDGDDEILEADKARWLQLKQNLHAADSHLMAYNYAQDQFGKCICRIFRHRILRNTPDVKWKWPIHECLDFPGAWSQSVSNVVVTHRRGVGEDDKDKGRNIRLLKKAIVTHPDEPRMKFYHAKECFAENSNAESIKSFEEYIAKGGDWHDNMVNAHWLLAMAYLREKNDDMAIGACIRGINVDPRFSEFYCTIGQIHHDKERWGQAIPWFEIASNLKMPEVFGTVIPDYYTWIPQARLSACYNKMGKILMAYEMNEKALVFRPDDEGLKNNREYLRNILYPGRCDLRPTRLSLGSGGKPTLSYRCTDMYPGPQIEELIDQAKVPYPDATVHAIYSEHALEHSASHYVAAETLTEWARILRHGGHLTLKLPDLDTCCEKFLAAPDIERQEGCRWSEKEWYRFTLFGIQSSNGSEPPEGQFHRTGFTKIGISRDLEKNGFEVRSVENYDGYGTPSMVVDAVQTRQSMRIAWMIPGFADESHGSLRIRRLNIHRWLQKNGVDSRIIDYRGRDCYEEVKCADVCVFISFGPEEKILIDKLKRRGVKIIYDHCEDIGNLPGQKECFEQADILTCCSTVLAQKSQMFTRTICLHDAYEV